MDEALRYEVRLGVTAATGFIDRLVHLVTVGITSGTNLRSTRSRREVIVTPAAPIPLIYNLQST